MASFVLAGGDMGQRIALPHSRVMIHQPEGGSQGQATEVFHEAAEVRRIRRQVGRIFAERTNQPLKKVAEDMDRDFFMSAKEAKLYGIVDQVAAQAPWGGQMPSGSGTEGELVTA
jgi:ATP-dependent Clp protease protease subunit